MLGSLRKPDVWLWGATGKHPVARDYISIGFQSGGLRIFANLVERGFMKTGSTGRKYVSYRYFLKGEKKGMISCGIFKDSRDAVGREYPLVVAGYGMLPGWEERWETLPHAMAHVCSEAEYIISRNLVSLDEFKAGLSRLGAPSAIDGDSFSDKSGCSANISGTGFIPLVPGDEDRMTEQVSGYMAGLKKNDSSSPEAVFIGGTREKSCLCIFRKPLDSNDVWGLLTYE
jgi:type VI secretion system protein VasJ